MKDNKSLYLGIFAIGILIVIFFVVNPALDADCLKKGGKVVTMDLGMRRGCVK